MGDFAGSMVGTLQFRGFAEGSDSDTEAALATTIAAAVRGDLAAFETIYREFAPRVYGLCLRLTGQREAAEDCTQESFVAAWRSLGRFEKRSLFSTWLQRIAIRIVLARRRGLRANREVGEPAAGLPDQPDHGAAPQIDLERAITALPEGARDVLVLVGIYGYSHREAASALGVAEGTCKAQLHRARGLLRAALGLEEV
jgi:RNA polymerase sigma-70 factor (ECF subfamily)